MKTSIAAVLAASACAMPAAHAQFSIQYDVGASLFATSLCDGASRCDRRGQLERLRVGYEFKNGLGLELAHVTYGSVYVGVDNTMWGTLKSSALNVGVSYRQPVWQGLDVVARGGLARHKAELTNPVYGDWSRTSSQPYAGVAVSVNPMPHWHLELGAELTRARHFDEFKKDERALSAWYFGTRVSF